jgi:hypothetical protein
MKRPTRNTVPRTSGRAIPRNTAGNDGIAVTVTDSASSVEKMDENAGESARNDVAGVARKSRRDSNGCLLLRPGQPHIGSKLDDALETKICGFIAAGMTMTDSALLCDVNRESVHRWKQRGMDEPESRYGLFLERVTKAEVSCKAIWVRNVARSDDWRAFAFLLKAKWPAEFIERTELSGPDGTLLALGNSAFNVVVNLSGPEPGEFTVIDHRHQEAATIPDPFATPPEPPRVPDPRTLKQSPAKKLSPYDPQAGRLYERGIE